eukprot:TRINITY_DN29784_c0_g1_i1.p1 TRINITY_DN29784_c0_g1~~TRINITY_DN29784_c0_g1_i1.p1  ORF type:complete len:484 (+),score=50.04 TRINITY_DN29784_c0_g1_i1:86-1537(+)
MSLFSAQKQPPSGPAGGKVALLFTPTFNSLEVRCGSVDEAGNASTLGSTDCTMFKDRVSQIVISQMATHVVKLPASITSTQPTPRPRLCLRLVRNDSTSVNVEARVPVEVAFIDETTSVACFHLMHASCCYSVLVEHVNSFKPVLGGDEGIKVCDIVGLGSDCGPFGEITNIGDPHSIRSWFCHTVQVRVVSDNKTLSRTLRLHDCVKQTGVDLAFNTRTLPGLRCLPPAGNSSFLLPWFSFGEWLLKVPGNYCYASSLDPTFVVRLLEHGLFVLPSDSVFSCPFPEEPFVFLWQASEGRPHTFHRSKMLRRYRNEFTFSCNHDFACHLRRCMEYHHEKGGTWINNKLIDLLVSIDRDPCNEVRMFCFELWEKATGALAAASFGFAIGGFFHDFSMCCLIQDRRSAGSILTKAIGSVLRDCGVTVWYWGCKIDYMREYEAHGAREISRLEYYRTLRAATRIKLAKDPAELIQSGGALIQPRDS